MTDASNRTFVGSILFLDIIEYSKRSVAEQMRQKQKFNALLEQALEQVDTSERIVLDTGDGAAISFLGNPEDALYVAMALRTAIATDAPGPERLAVRTGINLGPVRLIKDLNGQMNIIGDGINVAQRVMSFSDQGQILVSRSYYEVVSRLDPQFERLFRYEGARTDKHVREHEVYAVGAAAATITPPPRIATQALEVAPASAPRRPAKPRKPINVRLGVALPVVMATIIGTGVLVRVQRPSQAADPIATATHPGRAASASPKQASLTKTTPEVAEKRQAREAFKREVAQATEEGNAAAVLLIVPWGQVFVDGKTRGVSPPLRVLELPPGQHKLEIRNGEFPAYSQQVSVRAGEKVTIRHRFK
jgi:class 3 adenylate cyclase